MNVFNRVFTVVSLLALIFLAAVVLVAPRQAVDSLSLWLSDLEVNPFGALARIVVSLLVMALSFFLLFRELRRPPRSRVLVGNVEGAIAELSIDAIAQRLQRDILALEGVRTVKTTISPHGKAVDVRLIVTTENDVDVPGKAAEVGRAARESMEGRMGLRVGKLWVNINHEGSGASTPAIR